MGTPPISAVQYRRRLNEAAQQLRIIAATIDRDANELFKLYSVEAENADNLGQELEETLESFHNLQLVSMAEKQAQCSGCIRDEEGRCCK